MAKLAMTILYKYRPVNANTERILTHTELWCSAPSTFNDLHECCFRPGTGALTDHQMDLLRNWWRVVCFAGNPKDLLMWSHYTHQHRGICIGFTVPDESIYDPDAGKHMGGYHKVYYPDDDMIPTITGGDKKIVIDQLIRVLTTKSRHWKYENEYRLLLHPPQPEIMKYSTEGREIPFPPESLSQVYLGARISQHDQNAVIKCLMSRTHPVELFKARRHPEKYELIFDRLGTLGAKE